MGERRKRLYLNLTDRNPSKLRAEQKAAEEALKKELDKMQLLRNQRERVRNMYSHEMTQRPVLADDNLTMRYQETGFPDPYETIPIYVLETEENEKRIMNPEGGVCQKYTMKIDKDAEINHAQRNGVGIRNIEEMRAGGQGALDNSRENNVERHGCIWNFCSNVFRCFTIIGAGCGFICGDPVTDDEDRRVFGYASENLPSGGINPAVADGIPSGPAGRGNIGNARRLCHHYDSFDSGRCVECRNSESSSESRQSSECESYEDGFVWSESCLACLG